MVSHRLFAALAAVLLAACSGTPATSSNIDSSAAKSSQPTFTQEEKDNMSQEEKAAIHNATASENDQVVCRREVVTGSHRKKRVCRTSAQIKADQDAARESLRDTMRGTASEPTGGN